MVWAFGGIQFGFGAMYYEVESGGMHSKKC